MIIYVCFDVSPYTLAHRYTVWNKRTNTFKTQLEQKTGKSYDEGVELDMLEEVETEFNITINVYALQEDKSAKVVRLSDRNDEDVMHLNIYENHFSYITKFEAFAKKFQCPTCSRLIRKSCHLKRHIKRCQVEIKEIYIGGKYRNKRL